MKEESRDFENENRIPMRSAVLVKPDPMFQLRFIKDNEGSYSFVSDASLLMNAERIKNYLGDNTVDAIMRQISSAAFAAQSSPYRKQTYSDEELLRFCKSRYCQSPSEVRNWLDDLKTYGEDLIAKEEERQRLQHEAEIAAAAAARVAEGQQAQTTE